MKNVAVALVTLIASSVAQAQQAVQWRVQDGGNGHWYEYVPAAMRWNDAKFAADSRNGYLACLTSAAESAFVRGLGVEIAHLGGFQLSGACEPGCGWTWLSGEPWSYSCWAPTQPDNGSNVEHVLELDLSGNWNDYDASAPRNSYIIEWSADCNGDGIVDYGQCRDGSLPDYNGNNIPDCCESGTPCVVGNYPVQWRVEDGGNGHWYAVHQQSSPLRWDAAMQFAQSMGGYLSTLASATEDSWVRTRVVTPMGIPPITSGPWLGATCEGATWGNWRWVTGEPWVYSAWAGGEPNNSGGQEHYVQMYQGQNLSWNDNQLDGRGTTFSAIIEWSADCNNDGIVDIGQIYLQPELYADANSNGIPDSCEVDPCPGDITGGGFVDAIDLSILLAFWGSTGGGEFDADVNNDGIVEGADLSIVLGGWGPCPN